MITSPHRLQNTAFVRLNNNLRADCSPPLLPLLLYNHTMIITPGTKYHHYDDDNTAFARLNFWPSPTCSAAATPPPSSTGTGLRADHRSRSVDPCRWGGLEPPRPASLRQHHALMLQLSLLTILPRKNRRATRTGDAYPMPASSPSGEGGG